MIHGCECDCVISKAVILVYDQTVSREEISDDERTRRRIIFGLLRLVQRNHCGFEDTEFRDVKDILVELGYLGVKLTFGGPMN